MALLSLQAMAKIERFEDLDCWKQSRRLVNMLYDISEQGALAKDFSTRDQLRRAALSAMNNIAEGFGRYSNKEFVRFLEISQASAIEVRSMLYILLDRHYITTVQFDTLLPEIISLTNQVNGLIKYLKTRTKT